MALSGIEIFKLLPKSNCKKCGHPTCLAFAMKLAQRQASIDLCPDVSEESRRVLGDAAAPPVRPMAFGAGEGMIKMGEETVLFRHEKKFVNPCVFAIEVKDTMPEAEANRLVEEVISSAIDRVGQTLRIDALLLSNSSNDAARYEVLVKMVAAKAPDVPLILSTRIPAAAEAALKIAAGKKPVLYGADEANAEAMAALAKEYKVILGVVAKGPAALSVLTEKIKSLGVEDMVIDPAARTAAEILESNVLIRRSAVKKNFKPLGYPIITFAQRDDSMFEALIATLGIAKYASIIVLSSAERWKNIALFALRQNIYTDPQVPMQVEQKIYNVGEPAAASPLIVTTNFSLTYFIVAGEIENSRVASRLAIMDCEGMSVLTAWAAGKFTAAKIAQFILDSGVGDQMPEKELIIPGYVAVLSGALEEKLPGWKITVGPREANSLPAFLKARSK
jgi:acetyl-CoA decarbonylase/synthase, CODH/ACS complex subunit gamma